MTRLGGLLVGGALLLSAAGPATATTNTPPSTTTNATAATPAATWQTKPQRPVVRVVDGDTIDVAVGGTRERVRLLGIDAPETGTCYAQAATWHVNHLLQGKAVRLESDRSQGNRDRYGRLLRYVRMPSGTNLNRYLVGEGYAREYTYDEPYRYQAAFRTDQRRARDARRGLWGACPATPKPAPAPVAGSWVDRNCKDFATQREAQAYFTRLGGSRTRNVDGLDGNANGIACEALP
jgi:micrococcal nuclease